MTRLTNAFSKKAENLAAAASLHLLHDNFARPHWTPSKPHPTTPAMAAGVADRVWKLDEIAQLIGSLSGGRMKLRSATPGDHAALVQLQRSASLTAYAHVFPPDRFPFPLDETEERWQRVLSATDEEVIVAVEGRRILGVLAVQSSELHSLFVDPDHRGSGIGSSLVDAALRIMRGRGQRYARLWVMRENRAARRFYERLGWIPDGRVEASTFPPHPVSMGYAIDLSH